MLKGLNDFTKREGLVIRKPRPRVLSDRAMIAERARFRAA